MDLLPDFQAPPPPKVAEPEPIAVGAPEKGPPSQLLRDAASTCLDAQAQEQMTGEFQESDDEPRQLLRNDEIFRSKEKKSHMATPELTVAPVQGTQEEPIARTKTGRPKRQATAKQKAHLEKARLTRAKNKQLRDQGKLPPPKKKPKPLPRRPKSPEPEQDDHQQNHHEPQQMTPQPSQAPPVSLSQAQVPQQFFGYSQEEMNEAIFAGIQQYDGLRKTQKKEKKQRIAKEEHERRVVQSIQKAIGPTHQQDPWANVFSFQ